jgi:hypothetical protein
MRWYYKLFMAVGLLAVASPSFALNAHNLRDNEQPVSARCVAVDGITFTSCGGSGGTVAIDQTTPGVTNGVSLTTLISGEDQTNNLMRTSGGAVRQTQLVGTGGIPSTASNQTTAAVVLPVGVKTFHGIVTCTGTCVQTQQIYGSFESSATVAKSTLVCTIIMSGTTTATDFCQPTATPFAYWFVVTTLTSGTTPLAGLFVMY